jgi:hypothetical protein
MCRLSTDLICLGSRLGDSLLIKFTQKTELKLGREKLEHENGNSDDVDEPPEKRMKLSQEREREGRDELIENEDRKDMDFLEEGECIFYRVFLLLPPPFFDSNEIQKTIQQQQHQYRSIPLQCGRAF